MSDFLNMFGQTPGTRGGKEGAKPTREQALAEARRRAFREAGAEID